MQEKKIKTKLSNLLPARALRLGTSPSYVDDIEVEIPLKKAIWAKTYCLIDWCMGEAVVLPSAEDTAEKFEVSIIDVLQAYKQLQDEGQGYYGVFENHFYGDDCLVKRYIPSNEIKFGYFVKKEVL